MSRLLAWIAEWVIRVVVSTLLLCMALFLLPVLPFEHFSPWRARRREELDRSDSEMISSSLWG